MYLKPGSESLGAPADVVQMHMVPPADPVIASGASPHKCSACSPADPLMAERILVVEDSRTQAEHLRLLLSRAGYDVVVANTGEDGLLKARANSVDLVISDVTMPEMDGFDFCRAMKASDATAAIPIILLTSRVSPTDIVEGLESGADNFIPKTYDDEYLLERVQRILAQLAHRGAERLEMEVNLTVAGKRITVNPDRQQIMELLFSTFEELGRSHDELTRANDGLQRARAEAERANRAKSEFLSRMSHELRTPLNAIMGFGELLETADLEPDERDSAGQIVAAGRHLLGLVNEVLDIGRIDAGELALSLEPVRVGEIATETMNLIQPLADERSVKVTDELDVRGPSVMADRGRLRQVLLNLLSNAVKYNREAGSVTVRCVEGSEGAQRIEITDTGTGISRENLDRLFAPFDRIGAEQDSDVEGAGLGLALSRRLVEAMGGTLGVDSTVGVGSTFWVELPAPGSAEAEGPDGARDPEKRAPATQHKRATVIYIDDNASNVSLVKRILGRRPAIELVTATRGKLGLDLARQLRPDMILLDLNLPDIPGEEVLKQLRSGGPGTSAIPVVIVTADASASQAERLLSLGASDYITKPFGIQDLLRTIDATIAQS